MVGRFAAACLVVTTSVVVTACGAPGGSPSEPPEPIRHAVTASPSATAPNRFVLAAAGDIACQPPFTVRAGHCHQAATAALIKRRHPDGVLALGDTQYQSGELAHYRAAYRLSWGAFRAVTLPVVGNHEYERTDASGYFRYFGARAHPPHGWYAVNRGGWRIYVLNTNCSEVSCSRERRWLERDLSAHPHRCSLAAMHHPRYSSGPHGPSSEAKRFWPTLDRHQVDLALAGHDHDYERFAPMHDNGRLDPQGIRSFVIGTGGASLYPLGPARHGSRYRYDGGFGALFLSLGHGRYSWEFRTAGGRVKDRGSASCIR